MTLTIDPEFNLYIPALAPAERVALEASIVVAGRARDPLIVWQGGGPDGADVLLDGHNRHEICTRLGLPFTVDAIDLPDRAAAKAWMFEHQLARRNMIADQQIAFAVLRGFDVPAKHRAKVVAANQARQMVADEKGRTMLQERVVDQGLSIQVAHGSWRLATGHKPQRRKPAAVGIELYLERMTPGEKLDLAERLLREVSGE